MDAIPSEAAEIEDADQRLEDLSSDARALAAQRSVKVFQCKDVVLFFQRVQPHPFSIWGRLAFDRDCLALARDVATLGQLIDAEDRNTTLDWAVDCTLHACVGSFL